MSGGLLKLPSLQHKHTRAHAVKQGRETQKVGQELVTLFITILLHDIGKPFPILKIEMFSYATLWFTI